MIIPASELALLKTYLGTAFASGPASAVDSNFASFDGVTGKLLKDSGYSPSSFLTDAPADGNIYGRKNSAWAVVSAGSGDVVGPASAVDGNIVLFNGITGKIIKDSGVALSVLLTDAPSDGNTYGRKNAAWSAVVSGSGDVVGPASAVNNNVAFFDGITGKLIKDSGVTLAGSNTGDQTITLTGNVTGSGTGSFVTTIANSAVSLAMLANMATASLFYRKTAGNGAPEVNSLATLKTDLGSMPANAHNILSAIHGDTTTASAVLGDIITGQAGPVWARLAITVPAANVRNVLGVDNAETGPSWKTALDATAPSTISAGAAASSGTSLIFAHRDHVHGAPSTYPPTVLTAGRIVVTDASTGVITTDPNFNYSSTAVCLGAAASPAANPSDFDSIGDQPSHKVWGYNTTAANAPSFLGYKGRGTYASPAAVLKNDILVRIRGRGWTDANIADVSLSTEMRMVADENYSPTTTGGRFEWWTMPVGSATQALVMTLYGTGILNIPTGATYNINGSPHTHALSALPDGVSQYQTIVTGATPFAPVYSGYLLDGTTGGKTVFAVTSGKTLTLTATDNYNLTIPATGVAALVGVNNAFSVDQTIHGVLFSTYQGANSDGANIWIGGGGQHAVGAVGTTYFGSYNLALGVSALLNNTTGYYNSAIGGSALQNNTTGSYNLALGASALLNNTTGSNNSAIGGNALLNNTAGSNNSAIGGGALANNTTGSYNSALGGNALVNNTTGSYNLALGGGALANNTTGPNNSAIGGNALVNNTTGSNNSAIGVSALANNTTGSNNSAIGVIALYDLNITANDGSGANTAIGYNTGRGIVTGVNNTIIGANVAGLASGLSGNIIIADGAGTIRIQVNGAGPVQLSTGATIGADGGGLASTLGLTNVFNETISSGVGSVKMAGSTARTNTGWLKIYNGTSARYIPYWTTITG
jgi:hypothetical protein